MVTAIFCSSFAQALIELLLPKCHYAYRELLLAYRKFFAEVDGNVDFARQYL
jgi:hypothetical protein